MKTYFVYVLRCSDGSFYVGVTCDMERRLWEHQNGWIGTSYTHTRRPVELVCCSDFSDVEQAIAWEKQLKGWGRKKKEALVAQDWERIRALAHRPSKRAAPRRSSG